MVGLANSVPSVSYRCGNSLINCRPLMDVEASQRLRPPARPLLLFGETTSLSWRLEHIQHHYTHLTPFKTARPALFTAPERYRRFERVAIFPFFR